MGMTIDEAISEMELELKDFLEGTGNADPNVLVQKCKTNKDLEKVVTANNIAISTMRKYQKIEQIVNADLDKIRAEIEQEYKNEFGPYGQGLRRSIEIFDKYKPENKETLGSIPFLMHKEMGIPISECQKAYDVAIDYLRSQGRVSG